MFIKPLPEDSKRSQELLTYPIFRNGSCERKAGGTGPTLDHRIGSVSFSRRAAPIRAALLRPWATRGLDRSLQREPLLLRTAKELS